MMLLSRFWYVILALAAGAAIYVVSVAVGQYNRRNAVAMSETLLADSQVVQWELQVDARHRLDVLLIASVDKGIQEGLSAASGKDIEKLGKTKDDIQKALSNVISNIPADYRPDALFAVDRDGRVISEVGYDPVAKYESFELGGFPAVYDALHGWVRDDTWVWGEKIYRASVRPVEIDAAQPPIGAVVGLREVDKRFVKKLSDDTRTNVAVFLGGKRRYEAVAIPEFDANNFTVVEEQLPTLNNPANAEKFKDWKDRGKSGILAPGQGSVGVFYTRFDGDAFDLGAGFAVVRSRVALSSGLDFLKGMDDTDKNNVPWPLIGGVVGGAVLLGIIFSFLEHSLPIAAVARQAAKLSKGDIDMLQLPAFRGRLRAIAADINSGIERVAEKGGGSPRKQADLDQILGPAPVKPTMAAFSFPNAADAPPISAPSGPKPFVPPPSAAALQQQPRPQPPAPQAAPAPATSPVARTGIPGSAPSRPPPAATVPMVAQPAPPPAARPEGIPAARSPGERASSGPPSPSSPPPAANPNPAPAPARPALGATMPFGGGSNHAALASGGSSPSNNAALLGGKSPAAKGAPPAAAQGVGGRPSPVRPTMQSSTGGELAGRPMPPGFGGARASSPGTGGNPMRPGGLMLQRPVSEPTAIAPVSRQQLEGLKQAAAAERKASPGPASGDQGASTLVASIPQDVIDQASAGPSQASQEAAEWLPVYEDFIRTKKQCNEPTEGLTFEKFQATLRKNRDSLIERHKCKRVKFSVYVKDGRASLKATPVKE